VRGDLENIASKALKKSPNERYATVAAFEADLRNYLAGRPVSARGDDRWYRARKFIVRNRAAVAAASAIALALVVGAGVAIWQANVARTEANRAREINRFVLSLFRSASPTESVRSDVRAVELLKQAQQRIETDLPGRADLQAELLATVGSTLYDLAAFPEARAAFQRALELYGWENSARPSRSAEETALNFSDLLVIMGEYADAARLIERLEPLLRARTPSLNLVELLNQRSLLLYNTGREMEAIRPAQEGLRLLNSLPKVPPMKKARLTFAFARSQFQADQNQAAFDTAKVALADFESLGDPGRAEAVLTRALIARIVRDLGRTDEAAALLSAELPRIREIFGERSQDYVVNLVEYAMVQNQRGELEKAAASVDRALQNDPAIGRNNRSLVLWHRLAGGIALQLRDFASAREHFAQSEEHRQDAEGAEKDLRNEFLLWHTQVLNGETVQIPPRLGALLESPTDQTGVAGASVLVGAYCTLGWRELQGLRAEEAIAAFEAAARGFDKVGTHWAFLTWWCMTGFGRALLATHQPDRAEEMLTRSLQLHQQRQVRITPSRAETLTALAELHLQRGRAQQAVTVAGEADEFWQAFRPNSLQAGEAAIWHGRALIAAGQAVAGRRLIAQGRLLLSGSPFAIHRQLVRFMPR